MKSLVFPSGWYCDAVPSGAYVVLIPDQHLVTDRGMMPLPRGQNLLYVRMAPDGIRFAGAGHQDDRIWEWDGSRWHDRGVAYGVSPVIYNRAGELRINDGSWGSQGARYIGPDGQSVVAGDETYFAPSMELSEYSRIANGLYVGQSHPDGTNDAAWVWNLNSLRLLEPGPCRFIRASCDGEQAAIAIWKPGQGAVIGWPTLSELRALPPVPDFRLPNLPPPTPDPEPPSMDYLQIIRDIRNDYPTPLGARHWEFLVEVAQATGTQLYRKEDDNSVLIPSLRKRVSLDIIGRGTLGNQYADILYNSEGSADPVFQLKSPADGEYVDVSQVELPGDLPPAPLPPDPPPGDLESRVRVLEQWMARVRA
jgi:hypothetical protein